MVTLGIVLISIVTLSIFYKMREGIYLMFLKRRDVILDCKLIANQADNIKHKADCKLVLDRKALYITEHRSVIKIERENMIKAQVKIQYDEPENGVIRNQELNIYYKSPDDKVSCFAFSTENPQKNSINTAAFALAINKEYDLFNNCDILDCYVVDKS